MQKVTNGTKVTLDELETRVVEIITEDNSKWGLLNTETWAVIYVYETAEELVSQLHFIAETVTIG